MFIIDLFFQSLKISKKVRDFGSFWRFPVPHIPAPTVGIEWRAPLLFAVCGGPKNGEVRAARWPHYDSENRSYNFVEKFVRHDGETNSLQTALKTQSSHATVSLPTICCDAMDAWKAEQARRILATPVYLDQGFIFVRQHPFDGHHHEHLRPPDAWRYGPLSN